MSVVRPLEEADFTAIERLMDGRLEGSGAAWRRRLAWQNDANPWSTPAPRGMVMVHDGAIVGYIFQFPQPLWVAGTCSVGQFALDLYIDAAFRGSLDSLGLIKSVFPKDPQAIVATSSANDLSMRIWTRLGAKAQPDADVALIKPVHLGRLALVAAERALGGVAPMRVPLPWKPGSRDGIEINLRSGWIGTSISDRVSLAASLWEQVRDDFGMSTDRNEQFLNWRYGSDSPGGQLIGIFDSARELRAWYAFRINPRGGTIEFRVFSVLDLVAALRDVDAITACAEDAALRARGSADIIEARGMHTGYRAGLIATGFKPRPLEANPFLVVAKSKRSPALPQESTWHLVSADGDAGFG